MSLEDAIARGLRWLREVEQPADAIVFHLGDQTRAAGFAIDFTPRLGGSSIVCVAKLVRIDLEDARRDTERDPRLLKKAELERVVRALEVQGASVVDSWNGVGLFSGSFRVALELHPSLAAALTRYHDGCPKHGSVFCKDADDPFVIGLRRAVGIPRGT